MSSTSDLTPELDVESHGGHLPVDPFRALRVHFGMLLGVDDFETLDAYHRGKMWLHSAWLHGQGAVWGLNVTRDVEHGEIRVHPGLALDGAGHELLLEHDVCLNVGRWYEEHAGDVGSTGVEGATVFNAHVVMQFKPCLARQVPALVEPCDGSTGTTAYSRVHETVELLLRPGKAPVPDGPPPYWRLRMLFGLDSSGSGADADEVEECGKQIRALAQDPQPEALLAAFRRLAALDTIDLKPAAVDEGRNVSIFPAADPAPVVLANIDDITLKQVDGVWNLERCTVDTSVRPTHVATSTIQELLCGACRVDAGGPRVDAVALATDNPTITCHVTAELLPQSVQPAAFSVTSLADTTDADWISHEVAETAFDKDTMEVTVTLGGALPGTGLIRLVVRGTGDHPVLGENNVPLAGSLTDPPGSAENGSDFVYMEKRD